MSIRIRTVDGVRVALCAAESDLVSGDTYLDDGDHYALAAKFRRDWFGQANDFPYPREWAAMDTQKVRDAETELRKFLDDVTEVGESAAESHQIAQHRKMMELDGTAMKEVGQWETMESAPKDQRVLVWTGSDQYVARWGQNVFTGDIAWIVCETGEEGNRAIVRPTHWQPLPTPPTTTQGDSA